ncbi:MAG: DUF2169 family type VI secretion system accessory protein [Paracoccaceae bacterium]
MVNIVNMTPFANLRFTNRDAQGLEFGVFMAKTAMDIPATGDCSFSSEQEPFALTDEYHGAVNMSALRYASDFVPWKPLSDVSADATAFAPGGQPMADWTVGLRVEDALGLAVEKKLRVTGPRNWVYERAKGRKGAWRLAAPETALSVPLRYDLSFGGMVVDGKDDADQPVWRAYEHNPIGTGWIEPDLTPTDQPVPAPQIEAQDDPVRSAFSAMEPQGFGPIPPAWLPRRPLGGTYDQAWLDEIWPNWAPDYDFRFHNAAHPDLQAPRHLEGPLRITLENLHPDLPQWQFTVPDQRLVALALQRDGSIHLLEMVRDLVFLDIGEAAGRDPRLLSMWRTPFDARRTVGLTLYLMDGDKLIERGAERLTPADCACDPAFLDPDYNDEEAA